MKKFISLFLFVLLLVLFISSFVTHLTPKVIAQAGNLVKVNFPAAFSYLAPGDSFTNGEVTGQVCWRALLANTDDETGAPVSGLAVTLESDLAFEWVEQKTLTTMGPPTYEWFFGDLVEESKYKGWPIDAFVGFIHQSPIKFTPGFDASRSFDKTVFTAPDTQTVTITVTPREEWMKKVNIYVHTPGNGLADPVIISYSSTAGGDIRIDPGGHYSGIHDVPVELNNPVTFIVTIQVTPKVPWVEYKPYVGIHPQQPSNGGPFGTNSGSSFSYTNEAGTWTVSAEGNYVWEWAAPSSPANDGVGFYPIASSTPNIPPILTSGGVSPASGATTEPFAFEVTYKDADRDAPSYIRVYVDGSAKDMDFWSGLYIDGALFRYTTTLSAGQHTYYFEVSDGSTTARFPKDGTLSVEVSKEGQEPTPTPDPARTLRQAISWQVLIGIVTGLVVIGAITYLVIKKRRKA